MKFIDDPKVKKQPSKRMREQLAILAVKGDAKRAAKANQGA